MLRENPRSRPNVYEVLREACLMQGIEVPIRDVWITSPVTISRLILNRYTQDEQNQKVGEMNNYHLLHKTLHHPQQLELFFHHLYNSKRSSQMSSQCVAGGLRRLLSLTSQNLVLLHYEG